MGKEKPMECHACFLTILVPVYNAQEYLAETLDSLLDQDFSDYEILCIDDGSSDGSLEILARYQQAHSRIRVVSQKNQGVAQARNTGLAQARGSYVWFVDADDLVKPNCLGKLCALAEAHSLDWLAFGGHTVRETPSRQDLCREDWPCDVPGPSAVVWRSLLRREFLQEHGLTFRYSDITHGEDGLFMFEIARQGPRHREIPDTVYFYRVHPDSAETGMSAEQRRRKLSSHLRVLEVLKGYYEQETPPAEATANRLMAFLWLTLYEIAQLPRKEAAPALDRLKHLGLFPMEMPESCTLGSTYFVSTESLPGKLLDKLLCRLHRKWGYESIRLLQSLRRLAAGK